MNDNFYQALEERFRSSRDEIRRRLEAYQPFLQTLASIQPQPAALDLGCGRGEWLELLAGQGFAARGIDLDSSMVALCQSRGLNVGQQDALDALQACPPESLSVISAFHVVEHLPFDYLMSLLQEARRVLVPGGLLILETPNSENLMMGTNNFYFDPTHQRPVPALLLEFLCQYSGFPACHILRLQEDPHLHQPDARIGLVQVLYGVSPDYAIIACNQSPADLPASLATLFSRTSGFDLGSLADRHDQWLDQFTGQRVAALRDELLGRTGPQHQLLLQRTDSLARRLSVLQAQYQLTQDTLAAIYGSHSWRMTRPLRVLARLRQHQGRLRLKHELALILHRPVGRVLRALRARAGLHQHLCQLLERLPGAENRLQHYLQVFDDLREPLLELDDRELDCSPRVRALRRRLDRLQYRREQLRLPETEGLPRLAYVSPMPPARTGIAGYSEELLPALARHYRIDLIAEKRDGYETPPADGSYQLRDATWLRAHQDDYQAVLYHMGNALYHAWMLPLLAEVPGIVVLHDFYLSGLIWSLDRTKQPGIKWRELYRSHGYPAMQALAATRDESSIVMGYPVNRLVLDNALGVIVHADISRRLARQWYGENACSGWQTVPMLRVVRQPLPVQEARQRLNLPESAFVICAFGVLGMTKLNHRLLQAWRDSSLARNPDAWLIFVGQPVDDYAVRLQQCIDDSGLQARIRITDWVSTAQFQDYLSATDLAVQLRTFSLGETSSAVLDCLNYSVPTIVNANGSMADLPEDAVLRLPDDFTDGQLTAALEQLHQDPAARLALGQRGRRLIETSHSPAHCAERYRQAIDGFHRQQQQEDQQLLALLAHHHPEGQRADELQLTRLAVAHAARQPWPGQQPKLLLDVTATSRHDARTGIERVVRALCLALLEHPPRGWRVEPVRLAHDGQQGWHYRRAGQYSCALLGLGSWIEDSPLYPVAGDTLLVLDFSGDCFIQASRAGLYRRLQQQGVPSRALVFDLLPLSLPECFPPRSPDLFRAWLQEASQLDGALCISASVAGSLQRWLQQHQPERADAFRIDHFSLGADLAASQPSQGLPDNAHQQLARLASCPGILMVGTLEPRKNYRQALAAFDLLWRQGRAVNLVIVGREGWTALPEEERGDILQLVRSLRQHPEKDRHLFWLDDASDQYLARIYAACSGLLAASLDEGFGLPLVEAARHGLPILARDIPVFREVAGEAAAFFVAETPEQLATALAHWLDAGCVPDSTALVWHSWQHSASQLLACLPGIRASALQNAGGVTI